MIGVYNYSVILTYLGVGLSLFGITQALSGNFDIAILCLALAGACDTFDGKVARSMKNRTEEQIIFGIQIDSLCDAICFGVTPAIIAYSLGLNSTFGIIVEIVFVLCGVIRLAYFNVLEELKHLHPENSEAKMLPWTSDHIHRNYVSNYLHVSSVGIPTALFDCSSVCYAGNRFFIHMRFQNSEAFQCNGCLYSDLYGNRRIEDSSCILRGEPHEIC